MRRLRVKLPPRLHDALAARLREGRRLGVRGLLGRLSPPLATAAVALVFLLHVIQGRPPAPATPAQAPALEAVAAQPVLLKAADAAPSKAIRLPLGLATIEPGAGPTGHGLGGDPASGVPTLPQTASEATEDLACAPMPPLVVTFEGPQELRDVAQDLAERRRRLETDEGGLAVERAALMTARDDLAREVGRLETLKGDLERLTAAASADAQERQRRLVRLYETMKPKSAAAVFDKLDIDTSLPILHGMREARAAAIMGAMDPAKVRLLTLELARPAPDPSLP